MLIIDAHLDLSWNAIQNNRNLLDSVHTIRARERMQNTVALPEMRKGRVALSVATLFGRCTGHAVPDSDFGSTTQAYGATQGQLAYYRALEHEGHIRMITDRTGLDSHWTAWEAWEADEDGDQPPLGFLLSMEGVDSIFDASHLEAWHQDGLRLLGLTHYGPGRYAGGTGVEAGLTDLAPPLLKEMDRLGILLDLTHCSDRSFWGALDHYSGLVLASHNNCRALVPHQRQFDDDQLRAIIERGGVIGSSFDCWMLYPGWRVENPGNSVVSLNTVVDHMDHICQLAGNAQHVAIGSDLDGGFGWEQSPHDLDTIADEQKFTSLLADRGYSTADIADILHSNWLRLLRQAWGD
jgi:membrane dipeptidase